MVGSRGYRTSGPHPAPVARLPARPTAERSSSTRSGSCRRACRPACCACSTNASSIRWAAPAASRYRKRTAVPIPGRHARPHDTPVPAHTGHRPRASVVYLPHVVRLTRQRHTGRRRDAVDDCAHYATGEYHGTKQWTTHRGHVWLARIRPRGRDGHTGRNRRTRCGTCRARIAGNARSQPATAHGDDRPRVARRGQLAREL